MTMPLHRRACALGLTLSLGATAVAASASPTGSDAIRYVEGKAYASDGHVMYTESHWIYDDGDDPSRLVLYRCPDGKPFARKTLHDDGGAQAPDFTLDDGRTGYREGVRNAGGKREVFVRDSTNARERTATLDTSPMPVIDAGFDAYIRAHWDTLSKDGDTLPFLVPSRLGTLSFRVKRQADAQIEGRAARQYRLSLDSMIGFALPHLDVAYDAKTHELLSFDGIANIRSSSGKNVSAKILFDPSKNKDVARADLDAATKEPLGGQCKIP
ncbi:hypothetical protein HDE78_001379 [Rhodanobacter sp. K2T2]|uniref:hypothetical protein n=1 Tax=Rhodanobacter sp. K2T2 TaxID=2723085 RepID=UPI0015CD6C6A|nr:hypothetical protein [Rhodanobacter sp. K2T2]NYE28427.1 hypothetical protein [Rhodanobacter sp. K2T2]